MKKYKKIIIASIALCKSFKTKLMENVHFIFYQLFFFLLCCDINFNYSLIYKYYCDFSKIRVFLAMIRNENMVQTILYKHKKWHKNINLLINLFTKTKNFTNLILNSI